MKVVRFFDTNNDVHAHFKNYMLRDANKPEKTYQHEDKQYFKVGSTFIKHGICWKMGRLVVIFALLLQVTRKNYKSDIVHTWKQIKQ